MDQPGARIQLLARRAIAFGIDVAVALGLVSAAHAFFDTRTGTTDQLDLYLLVSLAAYPFVVLAYFTIGNGWRQTIGKWAMRLRVEYRGNRFAEPRDLAAHVNPGVLVTLGLVRLKPSRPIKSGDALGYYALYRAVAQGGLGVYFVGAAVQLALGAPLESSLAWGAGLGPGMIVVATVGAADVCWPVIDQRGRALHDLIIGSVVVDATSVESSDFAQA